MGNVSSISDDRLGSQTLLGFSGGSSEDEGATRARRGSSEVGSGTIFGTRGNSLVANLYIFALGQVSSLASCAMC